MQVLKARATVIKSDPDERYVFGPLYQPYKLDAHLEWTDPDELRKSLHGFMRGPREVRLQHSSHVIGEAVEGFSSPWALPVELSLPTGESSTITLPAGTTYMGAIIKPQFWPLYKRGLLRGWSMGGLAGRIEVDLEPGLELAKSFQQIPNYPNDLQVVSDLSGQYQIYSPSIGHTFSASADFAALTKQLSDMGGYSNTQNYGQPTPPEVDSIVRDVAHRRGMGLTKSGMGYTLVSPSSRYSSDVEATATHMSTNGYTPVHATNNWTNGSYGVTARYQDGYGHGVTITHHTPESHHYASGKTNITVPENARKIRLGTLTSPQPGAGIAPMMQIGGSGGTAVTGNVGEGIYGGENSLLAGAPPAGST